MLQVVLPTRPGITPRKWTLEGLDARVYPLVPLQVPSGCEPSLTKLTNMRFRLSFGRACRSVFALAGSGLGCVPFLSEFHRPRLVISLHVAGVRGIGRVREGLRCGRLDVGMWVRVCHDGELRLCRKWRRGAMMFVQLGRCGHVGLLEMLDVVGHSEEAEE